MDLLPLLQLRFQKQGLWKRNVFEKLGETLHHEILKVGTCAQGSPRSSPTTSFTAPLQCPSPQGLDMALLGQVDGSFLVACQDGNVQQPCHGFRGPTERNSHITAGDVQHGTGERRGCCLPCCSNCALKIHIEVCHPNALLDWKSPTAVATRAITLAAANWRAIAFAELTKSVMAFQKAARYTVPCQC